MAKLHDPNSTISRADIFQGLWLGMALLASAECMARVTETAAHMSPWEHSWVWYVTLTTALIYAFWAYQAFTDAVHTAIRLRLAPVWSGTAAVA